MDAVSAVAPPMVPGPAECVPDPRIIFTPIDPVSTEHLLLSLNIYDKWKHIITGLHEGFDMGIKHPPEHTIMFDNHASSRIDPEFISSYIENEEAIGRYSRAFAPKVLEGIIGPFRTSPIGLVPKPGSSKFRMIQDLSFPRNNPQVPSVNVAINSDDF